MTYLPIVGRELRVAARRGGTYWSRFYVVLAALVPTGFLLADPFQFPSAAKMGAQTFHVLAFMAFVSVLLAAVRLTADCLSSEKREGTLGLLFLTDLKPYDVVLGKLAATSLNAFFGLLALMPVMAIPILLGGVTLGDLLRLALVLINGLFFALSLAMLISVLSWHEKKAIGMTSLLVFTLGAGLPLAGSFSASLSGPWSPISLLSVASPGFAGLLVSQAAYRATRGVFWLSMALSHGLGWLCLVLTCRLLPGAWQDRPAGAWQRRWREFWRRALLGGGGARTAFRRRLLGANPVYWLASRERRACWFPWIFLVSMGLIGGFACWILRVRGVGIEALVFFSFLLNWFFKHWMINQACYALSIDRDRGALELLLSTPLAVQEVLRGQAMALRRQFLAPILTVIAVELVCFASAVPSIQELRTAGGAFWALSFLAVLAVFVADLFALVWVGWWAGLVSKNAASAVSTTYVRIMVLPWLLFMMGAVMAGLISVAFFLNLIGNMSPSAGLLFWVLTSLSVDFFCARRARARLLAELRVMAVERYSGGDAAMLWWRGLGRAAARLGPRRWRKPKRMIPSSR
ncbi:MAG TPA: ABC transporter permease [Candidatus Binatia bacterium]|nr:ABC transporter permease [Candidatus Binatia bacterium]